MYRTPAGEEIFVVDAHVHLWDARKENQRNDYGEGFISSFYDSHYALTPPELRWTKEEFRHYGVERAYHDLFIEGYCDAAVMLPVDLRDFFKDGFNTFDQCHALYARDSSRIFLNARLDPRDGLEGLERLEQRHARHPLAGAKFYTAEWKGASRGYSLRDEWSSRYLQKCLDLGIKNIHVHKGPSSFPLSIDGFDVRDVDYAASDFPELRFIVDHCGIPRIDDFCYIAAQDKNVYGGLAAVISFIWRRPKYFASILSELLFFCGPDRLLFGSDYGITSPKWLVEQFMAFEFDDETTREAGHELTLDLKRKIMGLNAAELYDMDVDEMMRTSRNLENSQQEVAKWASRA